VLAVEGAVSLLLGPFRLLGLIAEGGMGSVWQGEHVRRGTPVAIKFVKVASDRPPLAEDRRVIALHNEVRQVARLRHPNIIRVFDTGMVPEAVARASGGVLPEGSPYFVMEYGGQDTLATVRHPVPWVSLKPLLLDVLDALAHAHARGVIHRDLKPENVLLTHRPGGRSAIKLTDFGLATVMRDAQQPHALTGGGTPHYMAPEQFQGQLHLQGPWTDLYALGCTAWKLAMGVFPFQGDTDAAIRHAHLNRLPPAFFASTIPSSFEDWLCWLLAKNPWERPDCAAGASKALRKIPDDSPLGGVAGSGPRIVPSNYTLPPPPELPVDDGPHPPTEPVSAVSSPVAAWVPPPCLDERPEFIDVGLGLFELREVPFVGRVDVLAQLWSRLVACAADDRPRVLCVHGAPGVGKSRLVRHVAERAAELGRAIVLRAGAAREGEGPLQGLLRRQLRCTRLDHAEASQHLHALLELPRSGQAHGHLIDSPDMVQRVLRALYPDDAGQVLRPEALREVCVDLVAGLARVRPVVLLCDDLAAHPTIQDFAETLVRRAQDGPLPVLLLTTTQGESPVAEHVERVGIGPLDAEGLQELLGGLAVLDRELVRQVMERSEGNPHFAVRLVADWVRRDVLRVGAEGLVLDPSVVPTIPRDLYDLWTAQLGELPHGTGPALELAAVLGEPVDHGVWRAACHVLGHSVDGLVERLVRDGLAVVEEGGWRFQHRLIVESLLRRASEDGRTVELHRACALGLEAHAGAGRVDRSRTGRHWLQATNLSTAHAHLSEAIRQRLDRWDFAEAMALVALLEPPLRGVRRRNRREWCGLLLFKSLALHGLGRFNEAVTAAEEAADYADRLDADRLRARAARYRAMALAKQGLKKDAVEAFCAAQRLGEAAGDPETVAASLEHLGSLARGRGDLRGSERLLTEALERYRTQGLDRLVPDALKELSGTLIHLQNLPEAERCAQEAAQAYRALGNVQGEAECQNNLGEIYRMRGDLHQARDAYRAAFDSMQAEGFQATPIPLANMGLTLTGLGQYADAHTTLLQALAVADAAGRDDIRCCVHLFLLPSLAALGDWPGFRTHFDAGDDLFFRKKVKDPDIAVCARLAAELARQAGALEQAEDALQLARDVDALLDGGSA